MLIEKWYLDFQNDDALGYYYVGRFNIAGIPIAFSEIHHHVAGQTIDHQQMTVGQSRQLRSISSNHYSLQLRPGHVDLQINHNGGVFAGRWETTQPSLSQPHLPLYKNEVGSCRWKVYSPRSQVELLSTGHPTFEASGYGYIDYVQISIPTWKIPFRTLHWGRLFSDEGWICLFKLTTPGFERGLFANGGEWTTNVSSKVARTRDGEIRAFHWRNPTSQLVFEVTETLHTGLILDPVRTAWLPAPVRNWLSSGGFENKYSVRGSYNGQQYSGIMEEVRWSNNEPGTQIIW